ncbi:uncharacterized protein METZ01_LOCUS436269, partial [marine metagenome]
MLHNNTADRDGLPGSINEPINISVLGAGSQFTPKLVNDILQIPGAKQGHISLVDIDSSRLSTMLKLIKKLLVQLGRENGWTVNATTDRREALPNTQFLVVTIEVSGLDCE